MTDTPTPSEVADLIEHWQKEADRPPVFAPAEEIIEIDPDGKVTNAASERCRRTAAALAALQAENEKLRKAADLFCWKCGSATAIPCCRPCAEEIMGVAALRSRLEAVVDVVASARDIPVSPVAPPHWEQEINAALAAYDALVASSPADG